MTELLSVCTIIVILLSLTVNVIQRSREISWSTSCMSNQRQVGLLLGAYQDDNHGFLPDFSPLSGLGDRDNWYDLFYATDVDNLYFSSAFNPLLGIMRGNRTDDPRIPRMLEDYGKGYEVMLCPGQGPSASWKDVGPYYFNTNNPFASFASISKRWYPLAKYDRSEPLIGCQNPEYLLVGGDRGWRHGKRRGKHGINNQLFLDGSAKSYISPPFWMQQGE